MKEEDLKQLTDRGITPQQLQEQLDDFKHGFPFLKLQAAASIGNGIMAPDEVERKKYISAWEQYKAAGHHITKFVPASGAASRMFKNMFAFLHAPYDAPTTDFEKTFFEGIKKFAFREALCDKCKANDGKNIKTMLQDGDYKAIVRNMLTPEGLNYGQLPKGLLLFHSYPSAVCSLQRQGKHPLHCIA